MAELIRKPQLRMADALRLASKDMEFAAKLINDPDSLRGSFNLADEEVARMKDMASAALDGVKAVDPRAAD